MTPNRKKNGFQYQFLCQDKLRYFGRWSLCIILRTALDFCLLGAPRDLLREAEADPHSAPTWTGLPIALLPSPTPLGRLDPQVQTGRVTGAVAPPVFRGPSWNGLGRLTWGTTPSWVGGLGSSPSPSGVHSVSWVWGLRFSYLGLPPSPALTFLVGFGVLSHRRLSSTPFVTSRDLRLSEIRKIWSDNSIGTHMRMTILEQSKTKVMDIASKRC